MSDNDSNGPSRETPANLLTPNCVIQIDESGVATLVEVATEQLTVEAGAESTVDPGSRSENAPVEVNTDQIDYEEELDRVRLEWASEETARLRAEAERARIEAEQVSRL